LWQANERDAKDLQRLPASRQEAEAILQLTSASQIFSAHDFAANKRAVVQGDLQQYRYLHFATHSLFDNEHPALSGLALSLVNEQGAAQDGFVRLNDLFALRLNAELVTLSACRTALGKELRGEGLIGLARGFMYAGTPRVIASLWDVNDEATAALMKRFYQHLLKDGQPAAAALRQAQLELAKQPRWAAPYYWAGFVLLGDWK
jgi:CHAT domain-containing protein